MHQESTVAVEDDVLLAGRSERGAERDARDMAHRALKVDVPVPVTAQVQLAREVSRRGEHELVADLAQHSLDQVPSCGQARAARYARPPAALAPRAGLFAGPLRHHQSGGLPLLHPYPPPPPPLP